MIKYVLPLLVSALAFGQNTNTESRQYYYEGRLIKEIATDGIIVSSSLRQIQRNDGKYYTFDVSVSNNTDRDVTLITSEIDAEIFAKNGKSIIKPALTRKEYLKIKKRRQNMRVGLMALAGGMSAASAGYSTSTTRTTASANYSGVSNTNTNYNYNGNAYSNASAYGNSGYAYGSGYGNYSGSGNINSTSNYSGTAYGSATSTTTSYNGDAAYRASQNEQAKLNAFVNASENAKRKWNEEYLKNHTLLPQETTSGLINVKYYKAVRVDLIINIDNKSFVFEWDPKDSEY